VSALEKFHRRAAARIAKLSPWQWEAIAAVFGVTALMNLWHWEHFENAGYATGFALWCVAQAKEARK